MNDLLRSDRGYSGDSLTDTMFVLVLSFVVGQIIGWIYQKTHRGHSYSQSFTASIVVLPVLVAMMMLLMADNVSIAFGLLAVFAVVRFRNVLKDTRDTIFVLWSIIEGMAVGTGHAALSVIGAIFVALLMMYLAVTHYGSRSQYDTIVSLFCIGDRVEVVSSGVESIFSRYCLTIQLASLQQLNPDNFDLSYKLTLRDPSRRNDMETELRNHDLVERVSVFVHEDESEV
jgi:uncharacterized membrane protein YhiD involved in acid resistance